MSGSSRRALEFETALSALTITDVQLTPDGGRVVYVASAITSAKDTPPTSTIWLVRADGGPTRRLTSGEAADGCPRFSPDGKCLAFLSDRVKRGVAQLYLLDLERGGEARRMTGQPGGVSALEWSPDGRLVAYAAGDAPRPDEDRAQEHDENVVDENVKRTGLWLLSVTSDAGRLSEGELPEQRRLSPPGVHIESAPSFGASSGFDWAPDGRMLVASTARSPKLHDVMSAELITLDLDGQLRGLAPTEGLGSSAPRFSPDGASVAFNAAEGRVPSIFSLQTIQVSGGQASVVVPGYAGSFFAFSWLPDGERLLACSQEGECQRLVTIDRASASVSDALGSFPEPGAVTSFSASADGQRVAFVRASDRSHGELFISELGGPARRLSDLNPWTRDYDFGDVRELSWNSFDGLEIQGLLILPVGYREGARYPTVLQIHGGPMAAYVHSLHAHPLNWAQFLAQRGYAVLMPNPRGSSGRGTEFLRSIAGDDEVPDYEDLMSGVEKVIELGIADPEQLVVGGYSYGGYLTNWVITHTDRFKAAVTGAGVSNRVSSQGTSDARAVFDRYFGSLDAEPDNYWRRSPVRYIKHAKTPTLILFGECDERVPASQGYELYEGLKARGVETKLVVYPREGHVIMERSHQLDILRRVVAWYDRHLGRRP